MKDTCNAMSWDDQRSLRETTYCRKMISLIFVSKLSKFRYWRHCSQCHPSRIHISRVHAKHTARKQQSRWAIFQTKRSLATTMLCVSLLINANFNTVYYFTCFNTYWFAFYIRLIKTDANYMKLHYTQPSRKNWKYEMTACTPGIWQWQPKIYRA